MSKNRMGGRCESSTDEILLALAGSGWAWEYLRCNHGYRHQAEAAESRRKVLRTRPLLVVIEAPDAGNAKKWGVCFTENPDLHYGNAAVFWCPDIDPSVLPIAAAPANDTHGQNDVVDFCSLPLAVMVLKEPTGKEHVLLCDGAHTVQLHVHSGTVLSGPVYLSFQPERLFLKKEEMLTLDRFSSFRRDGRFDDDLFSPHPKAQRWLLALKVLSLAPPHVRPDYQGMATTLFREEDVSHWGAENDWIRSRLRRAVGEGRYLVNGGYLKILSSDNADFIPPRLLF